MKIKIRHIFPALMLCIGAFFTPVPAFAAGSADTDTTPPTVSAEVKDGTLHIEASDDDSGVDAVYIGRNASITVWTALLTWICGFRKGQPGNSRDLRG